MSTRIVKRITRRIQRRKDKRKQQLQQQDDDESCINIMGEMECSPVSISPIKGALHGSTRTLESSTTMEESSSDLCHMQTRDATRTSSSGALLRSTSQQIVITKTPSSRPRPTTTAAIQPILITPPPKRSSTRSPRRRASISSERNVGEQQQLERIVKAASALDKSGNELIERGDYDQAMTSYTKALKLKRRTLNALEEDEEESDENDRDDDDNAIKNNIDGNNSSSDLMLASVATSINNIGYLRQRSGASSDETMATYMDSLHIKRQILGRHDLSVGKTLNNIGSVHFSTEHFDKAMEAYQEARHIMVLNLGEQHLDVATVESNMGDVHLALGEGNLARIRYREALKIRWGHLGDHHPKVIRLLEKIAMIEMKEEMQNLNGNPSLSNTCHSSDDEEDDMPVQKALGNLRTQVRQDIQHVSNVQRELALDMVKDKLRMVREMRAIEEGNNQNVNDDNTDGENDEPGLKEPQTSCAPLTPCDRTNALVSVKERLAKFRESARKREERFTSHHSNEGISALRRLTIEDDASLGETKPQEKTES